MALNWNLTSQALPAPSLTHPEFSASVLVWRVDLREYEIAYYIYETKEWVHDCPVVQPFDETNVNQLTDVLSWTYIPLLPGEALVRSPDVNDLIDIEVPEGYWDE